MKSITFFDTEIDPMNNRILDIGGVNDRGDIFHSDSMPDFFRFIKGSKYLCGHNILNHDLKYMQNGISTRGINDLRFIDTLFLSPLLFPCKPYHALLKDDKLQTDEINNPVNDSKKAMDLFYDEIEAFHALDSKLKGIFYHLLWDKKEFSPFFHFLNYKETKIDIEKEIKGMFYSHICENTNISNLVSKYPIELSYSLALINTQSRYSITPPWVLKSYPIVENIMFLLRNKPCIEGCIYCNEALNEHKGLKQFFGYSSYRTFAGEPLQEEAVKAALDNKSLLAVFPTGGGKSITFQVPALMAGVNSKGLTVVISPLQSLMKDQVDNLEEAGITEAVTINGLLDPIERAVSFERVENGSASLLYIAPESLRSRTIEHLLLGRNVVRFVIDEAHCFSAWGQDFRVDYMYIGDFIKSYQEKKGLEESIPVSCFTATAKQKVIEDIKHYFNEKLSLGLELFTTNASRSNLHYKVLQKDDAEEKYQTLRNLIEGKDCPTIVYVSRTYRAYKLAERLREDGYKARPYHGKMKKQEKTENQNAFIKGEIQIMVATTAFGMGVDKKDVGMVIHYDISDSLENYVQEAGRAGRDESITADCYVLFNDEDLSKHFILLNQTKISIKEIQQVWKAIKDITRFKSSISQSALEIARKAGWDENVVEIETRVTTAIAALEDAGYLKRGQNMPRIFADSILSRNAQEAIDKINESGRFDERQKKNAIRIIKMLISNKYRYRTNDDTAESRIDYIADHLGIVKGEVIQAVNLLREEGILADSKDLSAYIRKKDNINRSLSILKLYCSIEKYLYTVISEEEKVFNLKELNEEAEAQGCMDVTPGKIKTLLSFLVIKNLVKRRLGVLPNNNNIAVMSLHNKEDLEGKFIKRQELAQFIINYLYDKTIADATAVKSNNEEMLVEFSVLELKKEYEKKITLFDTTVALEDVEDALFYLSKIESLKIEGGFLVTYNALSIERIEKDNKKRYKAEDYEKLNRFYENRIQQIHIVGEYAKKMINDYKSALQFVDDYFQLNYTAFLNKYFKGSRKNEIGKNITPSKFRQLFGELSASQLGIINDNKSKYIVVAAGPGSGKTRILVHKLASLLLMEDVKHEQLLMVTFSRSAATEFKKRLLKLIGNAANFIEIKTFHSYCFDLLGKVGTIEKSDGIIKETVEKIRNKEVELSRITKTVLVIDEAQDMDEGEFELINVLMDNNEEMRVIAVGDDDQNIYEFRGSSSKYMSKLITEHKAVVYELIENYRSKRNIVDFGNQFIKRLPDRLKKLPNIAIKKDEGNIRLVRYSSNNLISPIVKDILAGDISGSTCVLTKTNEEALQITGLLINGGLQAKLIQSNEGFNLYNIIEIRYFLDCLNLKDDSYSIGVEDWNIAKRKLIEKYQNSINLEVCLNLINDFESTNPRTKYVSDLEIFIKESKLEDFLVGKTETVYVSTMHKAKGREYDNVYIILDDFIIRTEENMRLLYVAMTRAKNNLTIHSNKNYFSFIKTENIERINDAETYEQPNLLAMQLTHKDVWLDYSFNCQRWITQMNSGDILTINSDSCYNQRGQEVLRFSKTFIEQIEEMNKKGYTPTGAMIRFVIYWKRENTDYEIRIILPEVYFEKGDHSNLGK